MTKNITGNPKGDDDGGIAGSSRWVDGWMNERMSSRWIKMLENSKTHGLIRRAESLGHVS